MKKQLIFTMCVLIFFLTGLSSCSISDDSSLDDFTSTDSTSNNNTEWRCGTYNGHDLWTGPQGGCYYYNSNDNKTYVDRDFCNC